VKSAYLVRLSVRRETGKELTVRVRHNEGIAIHIGPEPCIVGRKARDEASVGERTGQPLSRESVLSQVPTAYSGRKATLTDASTQVSVRPGVVEDPGMCGRSLRGNREIPRPTDGECPQGPHREGEEP
jgi:hypothetical protein